MLNHTSRIVANQRRAWIAAAWLGIAAKMGSAHIMLAKHKHEPKSSATNRKIV